MPNRPGIGGGNLPNRPGINPPNGIRPERPGIGGGDRPNRPGIGGGNRPDIGNRPERPIVGGGGGRPGIERPTTLPERPIIGGGNVVNRPGIGIGNGNNINNININNRRPVIGGGIAVGVNPGWGIDPGFSRPGWNNNWNGNWNNHWHDHCVRPHYGWYHGCWNGSWGNYWYAPLVTGATIWGLNAFGSTWGYGPSYYNPYYTTGTVASAPYDYSQPVVINNYVSSDASDEGTPPPQQESPEDQQALAYFDEALAAFKGGEYSKALAKVTLALKQSPNDPVMHEFRALTLFAQGEFKEAAGVLNSLLATAPGMDWTTISSLYGNPDDYTTQLRRLEEFTKANPKDASAHFLLAYHYLVLGHPDEAIAALKVVTELEPKDSTAQRLLAALNPPKNEEKPAEGQKDEPQTDLVGSWKATAGQTTIELSIGEDSSFTWKAINPGQPPKELTGTLSASADTLSLDTKESGSMAGKVTSGGPDKFTFLMQGMLPTEPGLSFERMK